MDYFTPYSPFGGYNDESYYRPQPRRQSRQQMRKQQQREAEAREYARRQQEAEAHAYYKHKQQQEAAMRAYQKKQQQQQEARRYYEQKQREAEVRAYYDQLALQKQQQARRQQTQYQDPISQLLGLNSTVPYHDFEESDEEYPVSRDVTMTSPTHSESNSDANDSGDDVFYDSLESAENSDEDESDDDESDDDESDSVELPPTVVVYSTPPPKIEVDVTKRLEKMLPSLERYLDTYERIQRSASSDTASETSDDYESLLNSTKSRLKVIQNAQIKLEQLYDQLDSIKTDNKKDKALRTAMIKKSVGTAEAIDAIVATLKEQRNYYKRCLEEEDTSTDSESVSDCGSDNSSDIIYHVTLEEVPDSEYSDLSE